MKYQLAILTFCIEAIVAAPVFAQAPAPSPAPIEEPRPVLAVPPGYRYEAHGRRDPFVNPIPKPPELSPAEMAPPRPPGMKGASEVDVTLLGVFINKNDPAMTRAILQVPGMKAPVMAVRGDVLYDAVIKEIRPDLVIFTMVAPGNKPRNPSEEHDVVKKLRTTAGDKK